VEALPDFFDANFTVGDDLFLI
jgi:hypothetical protein